MTPDRRLRVLLPQHPLHGVQLRAPELAELHLLRVAGHGRGEVKWNHRSLLTRCNLAIFQKYAIFVQF